MDRNSFSVVLLCGQGQSSRIMYHGISPQIEIKHVFVEKKPSTIKLIRRRLINLGIFTVGGQLLFIALNKFLSLFSNRRKRELIESYALDDRLIPEELIISVDSINEEIVANKLVEINPDAVIVNGTRIISPHILSAIEAPFVNTHVGITPKYRGVHGGYWALAEGDWDNCGVTVHLVDIGIDTGGILYQDVIKPNKEDNINTYPIHQIAKAIPLMVKVMDDIKNDSLEIRSGEGPSQLWYHPTIWKYFLVWISQGIN